MPILNCKAFGNLLAVVECCKLHNSDCQSLNPENVLVVAQMHIPNFMQFLVNVKPCCR